MMNHKALWWIQISVADPDPLHTDPGPAYRFDTNPDNPDRLLTTEGNIAHLSMSRFWGSNLNKHSAFNKNV
jgi:hypothetical protein